MEINSVVNINGALSKGAQPLMYIWCAHTRTESPQIPAIPITATLKLKSGRRVNTGAISISAATAGINIT